MRCAIISASPVIDLAALCAEPKSKDTLFICADGGMKYALQCGIKPRIIIGDFDSLDSKTDIPYDVDKIALPCEKDDTDTMAAVRCALEKGCDDFVFYGCTGGRMDHTVANLNILLYLDSIGVKARIIDPWCSIEIMSNKKNTLCGLKGRTVSLLAIDGDVTGITITGMKYPLKDAKMSANYPIGVSNVILEQSANIEIKKGRLLLFIINE